MDRELQTLVRQFKANRLLPNAEVDYFKALCQRSGTHPTKFVDGILAKTQFNLERLRTHRNQAREDLNYNDKIYRSWEKSTSYIYQFFKLRLDDINEAIQDLEHENQFWLKLMGIVETPDPTSNSARLAKRFLLDVISGRCNWKWVWNNQQFNLSYPFPPFQYVPETLWTSFVIPNSADYRKSREFDRMVRKLITRVSLGYTNINIYDVGYEDDL